MRSTIRRTILSTNFIFAFSVIGLCNPPSTQSLQKPQEIANESTETAKTQDQSVQFLNTWIGKVKSRDRSFVEKSLNPKGILAVQWFTMGMRNVPFATFVKSKVSKDLTIQSPKKLPPTSAYANMEELVTTNASAIKAVTVSRSFCEENAPKCLSHFKGTEAVVQKFSDAICDNPLPEGLKKINFSDGSFALTNMICDDSFGGAVIFYPSNDGYYVVSIIESM